MPSRGEESAGPEQNPDHESYNHMASTVALLALTSGQSRQHTQKHPRRELLAVHTHLDTDIEQWKEEQCSMAGRTWLDTSREARNCTQLIRTMHQDE